MAIALTVSFLAGAQGNAFHRDHGMLYGNTAMTFVLQSTFSFVGRAAVSRIGKDGEPHLRYAAVYGVVIVGFALGGAIGFLLNAVWGPAPLFAAAVCLGVLGAITVLAVQKKRVVDPQSAPTP